jgi:chemotaxis signal transduction protein
MRRTNARNIAADPIISRLLADMPRVETVSRGDLSGELPVYKAGKYLTFRIARQDFAMLADCVRGILPMHEMISLETPHEWICGFAAVGGHDFPVVDLRAKLGIAHGSHGREPFIIVVETAGRLVGFVADRVTELVDLRTRDFRGGTARTQGRPRRILDPDRIMKEEDWAGFRVSP